MAADANSAFGRHLRPQRRTVSLPNGSLDNGQDASQSQEFLNSAPIDPYLSISTTDALPPSRTFPAAASPAARTQAASLAPGEWLDREKSVAGIEAVVRKCQDQLSSTLADQVTPVRLASHLSVLAVAALVLLFSRMEMPNWNVSLAALPSSGIFGTNEIAAGVQSAAASMQAGGVPIISNESLQRATVPYTIVQQKEAQEIQVYIVQPGDTVLGIAEKFGLQPETIQWANSNIEANPDVIRPGDPLNILPVNGALHTVAAGDTLSSIANKYKVTTEDILNFPANGLVDPTTPLVIGSKLIVPGGVKPFVSQQVVAYNGSAPTGATKGSGAFLWPTSGSINQRYWGGHTGIDIGAWTGSSVKAADGGYVAVAGGGWNGGYGNHVIIDHGNGFVTLYAHLNSIFVRPGESVTRGQQIGSVGNTGNSTGPHLHFEIRYQGAPRNPFNYLP